MHPPQEPIGTAWRILGTGRSDPRWAPYLAAFGGDEAVRHRLTWPSSTTSPPSSRRRPYAAGEVSSLELTDHYLARIDKLSDTRRRLHHRHAPTSRASRRARLDDEARQRPVALAAARRPRAGQRPQPHGGRADDLRQHGVRRLGARRRRPRRDAAARCAARSCSARPTRRSSACPAIRRTAIAPPARTPWDLERMAGGSSGERPRRSPRASRRWRTATTAAAPSASPPAAAACSGSSPPAAGSAAGRSRATCRGCPSRACWPARCATPLRCSTSWRADAGRPLLGAAAAAGRDVPRATPSARRAGCASAGSPRRSSPTRRCIPRCSPPTRRRAGCSSRSGTTSRT